MGNTISFLENGVQQITATDGNLTGGAPGIMAYGNATADNWAGEDASSGGTATSYSVGGTVSGLSGTVVLQDNGGDDLSLSGNGSFTFATQLAAGAAYNVTVKTSPGRADLPGVQRLGHGGLGQRHQRGGLLRPHTTGTASRMISTGLMAVWGRTGRRPLMAGCRSRRRP